jgi:hypothetical protein
VASTTSATSAVRVLPVHSKMSRQMSVGWSPQASASSGSRTAASSCTRNASTEGHPTHEPAGASSGIRGEPDARAPAELWIPGAGVGHDGPVTTTAPAATAPAASSGQAVAERLGYRPFDADNHYYEALDAFTRHLDPRSARA